MKIGIIGILQNPSTRITSHNAGWTFVTKALLEEEFPESEVVVMTEKEDWSGCEALWIQEGVNYNLGTWNLFGGVSEKLIQKLNKLENFSGEVYFWDEGRHEGAPDYNELCDTRKIDVVLMRDEVIPASIGQSNKIILGDSHSISVFEPGWDIRRNDGKTLFGFLKDGLESHVPLHAEELRFYAGNIDIRHHLCREGAASIQSLVDALETQLNDLELTTNVAKVEIVAPLPIEDPSRKLPKTGYYKGTPFFGSIEEREACVEELTECYRLMCERNGWQLLEWPDTINNELGELDFDSMEATRSVHLAPHSYMFAEKFVPLKNLKTSKPANKVKAPKKVKSEVAFEINPAVLEAIDDYHEKSLKIQKFYFEDNPDKLTELNLMKEVDDDLIFHVPIYDVLDRRFAAFSSFPEALWYGDEDPKQNGVYFSEPELSEASWIYLFYLFRLCGSGINYLPKEKHGTPFGTHGFGNFWLVEQMRQRVYDPAEWLKALTELDKPFTDNKGYLLPQFSYEGQNGGHLKRFILEESEGLVQELHNFLKTGQKEIIETVDFMNEYLVSKGVKKQNFVLSATAADIAEYFPHLVDPDSMIYAGTNARRCIKAIFTRNYGWTTLEYESACLQFLADRYGATPYSIEDSRLCDVVRYFQDYQSRHHIKNNEGTIYKNNSFLRRELGELQYQEFVDSL